MLDHEIDKSSVQGMRDNGFAVFNLRAGIEKLGLTADLERIFANYENLSIDPYDENKNRFRQYGRAVYMPWSGAIDWIPGVEMQDFGTRQRYFQGPYNPEHFNKTRHFAAIPMELCRNPAMDYLVRSALSYVHFDVVNKSRPAIIGVHFISQRVTSEDPEAIVSPNCMHQDGEMYDFVILMDRTNAEGGRNCVGTTKLVGSSIDTLDQSEVLAEFTLTSPLEGFGVEDVKVSHGVEPIRLVAGAKEGFRNTLLIDVTPLTEDLRALPAINNNMSA
ncbi:MAG: 2OG-Fe dioxygenase family protein [Sulfitobacter sp.]